jgi:transgelin
MLGICSCKHSSRMLTTGRGGGYGLDAELARKQAANYDYNAETAAREWVESVVGESFDSSFGPSLKDGKLLCKLVNAIAPGSVKKINDSKMPFKQMENVSNFLKACRSLGVAEHSLFETVDLFEEKVRVSLRLLCITYALPV